MSCNGCRVLRKGCSENCALRPCLQWIDSPEAQGNATVFLAKFFGRAGLMEFISAVPDCERTALFQSLLYEACGRTVNPVHGALGLLWSGKWHLCHEAVESVLKGRTIRPLSSTPMAIGSKVPRDLSTKLQLATNSAERSSAVHSLPSLRALSKSPSSSEFDNAQPSQPKRTLDSLYEREVGRESCRSSECKQHRHGSAGDILKMNTVPQSPTAGAQTFFCYANPQLLRAQVTSGAATNANGVAGSSQINRVALMTGKGISSPRRARVEDLSLVQEDASSKNLENLELDLTLSSARLLSTRSGGKSETLAETTRVSSSSTISFNSEGSVTNLGNSDFLISSCSGHHLGSRQWKESEHKLLDLLV